MRKSVLTTLRPCCSPVVSRLRQQIGLVQNPSARRTSLNGPWKIIVDPTKTSGYYTSSASIQRRLGADASRDKSDRWTHLMRTPYTPVPGD